MFREAELLDGGQFREWLGLLDPDIRYVVPVRTTRRTPRVGWARSRTGTTTTRVWRCGFFAARRTSRGPSHLGRGPGTSCPTSARLPDRGLMS
nr:aromatic-ring-hydroxylating dioxygenase subunit beta [Mycobacterium gallinarum]